MRARLAVPGLAVLLIAAGCSPGDPAEAVGPNPFLEPQDPGKADTGYQNPDGLEVELDFEADVTAAQTKLKDAPAEVGQYAMTYLRKTERMYLETWAEIATSEQTVEWLVDGTWLTAAQALAGDRTKLSHFRLRGLNAVLLKDHATGVTEGTVFTARVPLRPYTTFHDLGAACADVDPHYPLDQEYYWDAWNPDQSGCPAAAYQEARLTITKVLPIGRDVYPEYDKLVADGKVTAVFLFGQMGDGETVSTRDEGMQKFREMATWLKDAGFKEVTPAPVGRRFRKTVKEVLFEIDLYAPTDFRGLEDTAHFATFQKALSEHEIVAYDGHSVLGASDFWSRPEYPDFYQIYLYGGCLGYEYYLRPIMDGKGGWANLDILSSVVEVSATAAAFAAPVIARIMWAVEHGYSATWRDILVQVRRKVGDSTFGVSGVKENCFSPQGSICGAAVEQDWTRDVTRTDLTLDVTALEGTAVITLAPATSGAASFSVGDLTILEVKGPSGNLDYTVAAEQMNVRVPPSTTPTSITVRYNFVRHTSTKGYSRTGLTMLWPYLCGYLFPCKPNPDDGLRFGLNVTGVPAGRVAVYPTEIPADAPSYMVALAVGDYQELVLGTTPTGHRSVSVWYYTGEKSAAVTGTRSLVAAFDWLERAYGPYVFGAKVGSVAAAWEGGGVGGMEHHPYWHVSRDAMSDGETHIHEAAHGWFGDGVRIRCWEDFVLSEGTTSYVTARAIEAVEGAAAGQALWASYRQRLDAAVASGNTMAWPSSCNTIELLTDPLWSDIPYMKGAFFLRAVEQQVGRAALDRALKNFYTDYVGLAVGVGDLLDTIRLETGTDVAPLADIWLRTLAVPE
ncbi:MAG TPA: M1 family aminopeptidase [Polyangia bacterium]|jgi:hypothetical protein